jgi:regulatory protein
VDDQQILKSIKNDCLRLLTRREHSRKEIEQKLTAKGYPREQVATVINELTKQSWQDDSRYAESYLNMRSQKGFGPVKIAYELRQQGVDKASIDDLINARKAEWVDLLQQLYIKKFANPIVKDNAERSKRIRFLSQRGFPSDMIINVLEQFKQSSKICT